MRTAQRQKENHDKKILIVLGIVFVLVGIAGFVADDAENRYARLRQIDHAGNEVDRIELTKPRR